MPLILDIAVQQVKDDPLDSKFMVTIRTPADARRMVRTAFTLHHVPGRTIAMVEHVTSELVTNAVFHGKYEPSVALEVCGHTARVLAIDADLTKLFGMHDPEVTRENGRGLLLVEKMASSRGVLSWGRGKSIWFEDHLERHKMAMGPCELWR
jgi:anti-sigma regulatory factor (Ser/Thr protein kinase)